MTLGHAAIVDRLRAAGCVFAEEEAHVLLSAAEGPDNLAAMVDRRVEGEPLEYVVGWAEFCGIRILVAPGVFVPRPRSELLVTTAAELARPGSVVVDLCCGSGALGVALAAAVPGISLHSADVDPDAVACARRNVEPIGGTVYEGDLFDPLPATLLGRVGILLANTPYVPSAEVALLPREARLYEHSVALDGGADGLDLQRRVAAEARKWLAPGGHLLVETSERQAPVAAALFTDEGLTSRIVRDADLDATVVVGTARPSHR